MKQIINPLQNQKRMKSLLRRGIHFFFRKNLFLTNSLSSGGFMAAGDLIQQQYELKSQPSKEKLDWYRAGRMFIVGGLLGGLHHHYYVYLDKLLPRCDFKTVLKKVAADQFICAPPTIVLFFYSMGLLENKNLKQCTNELTSKFIYVYMGDWAFWPPIQMLNFYYLPTQYRVFYINAATMVFDVFLSFMKHFDQQHKEV